MALHSRGCPAWTVEPDQISCAAGLNSRIQRGSGELGAWAGGLTISLSRSPFRTAYLPLFFSSTSTAWLLCTCCTHEPVLHFISGSVCSMCNDAQSRLAYRWWIYSPQTEQACCQWVTEQDKMEQSVESLKNVFFKNSILFLYFAQPIILNDRYRIYLYIFLCDTFPTL